MPKVDWYSRGRDACAEGLACEIRDARISGADRQAWYDGWQYQQGLNSPMSEEDRREVIDFLRSLK